MSPQAVKGTQDILPESQRRWRHVMAAAQDVLERAGVQELATPIFEYADVFTKSVGESSDLVVQHEMYTFEDRGGRMLTLRPEFTAGVMRAFIEHGMAMRPTPVKLWSRGPVFRAERPQRGRYRQFHQVNCELLGLDTPLIDAEAVALLYDVLTRCGLKGLVVKLGSLGDPQDAQAYNRYLRETLEPQADRLSETSRERLRLNPMRILDAKDPGDQAVVRELKRPLELINPDARAHFEAVQGHLRAWGVPFEIDGGIVRGLDYYRRTAFEIHHAAIGAQSALCGGGRYDGLVESLGGPATPGVGWAFGVERVLDALEGEDARSGDASGPRVFLVPMDERAVAEVAAVARDLRGRMRAEHAYVRRNPGKGLKDADRSGAEWAALRGERERAAGVFELKRLETGEQHTVPEADLAAFLERNA